MATTTAKKSLPPLKVPEDFKTPEPKTMSISSITQIPTLASGGLAVALRAGTGATTVGWKPALGEGSETDYALQVGPVSVKDGSEEVKTFNKPTKPIILYEYEASPYCRKVRDAACMLDLTVTIKPCPRFGTYFREELGRIADKQQFPYMIDENTGDKLYESDAIIQHLFNNYGPGEDAIPVTLKGQLSVASAGAASAVRGLAGGLKSRVALPENGEREEMTLWGYEGSPFVKPVREELTALQLPHKIIYTARGSENRNKLLQETGRFQVPYLVDPNTEIGSKGLFESAEIVKYLQAVYSSA